LYQNKTKRILGKKSRIELFDVAKSLFFDQIIFAQKNVGGKKI